MSCPSGGAAESDAHDGAPLRVLIVEDYADCAQSTAVLLRLSGYDVAVAESGLRALALVQADWPDVVLLDIGLPGMDGWELATRIRAEAAERRPWLIAITGYGRETDRHHSGETGIDLHLTKPVDPVRLEALLKGIARNHLRPTEGLQSIAESELHHGKAIIENRSNATGHAVRPSDT